MQLRYENGTPSKRWIIGLPGTSFKADGAIKVMLNNPKPVTVKARYKGNKIVLTFNRICDGKAVLYVTKRKRGIFEKPSVEIDEPISRDI